METLGATAFHAIAAMIVMLMVWLAMGKRQLGEFTPFDFAISITSGTVAGAGIADPRIELSRTIVALVILGGLQIVVSWASLKFRRFNRTINAEPTVVVENGQILKINLEKLRMPVEMLLQLLREKEVFDISEVEVAILEPHGKLSVLKKAEYAPVTPKQLNVNVAPNKILIPVIVEGQLQGEVLKKMGFTPKEIDAFRKQYKDQIDSVFIAFMDKNQNLHITNEDTQENGVFLH